MGDEGRTPVNKRTKDLHLKKQYEDMRRNFAAKQAARYPTPNPLGAWRPAPMPTRRPAFTDYRSSHDYSFSEDHISQTLVGRGYTAFEDTRSPYGSGKAAAQRPRWEEVKPLLGSGLSTRELPPWDPKNVVCFAGRDHWMANFHREAPIHIDGHSYPTVEHYYQACKLYMLGGAGYSNQIRRIGDPGAVKVATKKLLLAISTPAAIESWKVREGPRLLEYGMMHKFVQSKDLRERLLDTGNAVLIHTYDKDRVFAAGMKEEDLIKWVERHAGERTEIPNVLNEETIPYFPYVGSGKNILGLIAMRVRDTIRGNRTRIECMEEAAEAATEAGKKRELERNALEDQSDPILAKALASLASMPKTDEKLLQKIRELKIQKDAERKERVEKREEARKAKETAAATEKTDKEEESTTSVGEKEEEPKKEKKQKKDKKKEKKEKEKD